jgi:hypothetical protein
MTGSSGGWSSPRGDEAAVAAQDSSPMGVLRWLGWDERHMGMQEESCAADSTWRERERGSGKGAHRVAVRAPFSTGREGNGEGGPGGRVRVEDGVGRREGGPWRGGRQCEATGMGPRPLGAGGAIAA